MKRSNDNNTLKVLKEKATKENPEKTNNRKYTYTYIILHNKERYIKNTASPLVYTSIVG